VTSPFAIMAARFLRRFHTLWTLKVNFFCVDKTLRANITVKVIRKFCTFRKMDKMYMLILASTDL